MSKFVGGLSLRQLCWDSRLLAGRRMRYLIRALCINFGSIGRNEVGRRNLTDLIPCMRITIVQILHGLWRGEGERTTQEM